MKKTYSMNGTALRRIREEVLFLSQGEAARRIGISAQHLSDLERGVAKTSHGSTVRKIIEVYGVEASEILRKEGNRGSSDEGAEGDCSPKSGRAA